MSYWQASISTLYDDEAEGIADALAHYECYDGRLVVSIEEDEDAFSISAYGNTHITALKIFCAGKTIFSRTYTSLGREVAAILDGNGDFSRTNQKYSPESGALIGNPKTIALDPAGEKEARRRLSSLVKRVIPLVRAAKP